MVKSAVEHIIRIQKNTSGPVVGKVRNTHQRANNDDTIYPSRYKMYLGVKVNGLIAISVFLISGWILCGMAVLHITDCSWLSMVKFTGKFY